MRKRSGRSTGQRDSGARNADPVAGMAGSIAHDFSNLVMIIRNVAGFLQQDLDADDPRQRHVSELLQTADRARQLTEQLQAIGRSQLLKPEPLWPGEVLTALSDTLKHLLPADVEFRISIRSRDAPVLFDAAQLPIVVMRLLSYAAERIPSRGTVLLMIDEKVVDQSSADEHEVAAGSYVTITVASSGQELDDSEKKGAFKPLLAGKNLPRGTDLRLASVHGVVRQSGGFVDATSEPGLGMALTVSLPLVAHKRETGPIALQAQTEQQIGGNEIILVVEDDASVRNVLREALERHGYTVLVASDGAAALRLMQHLTTLPDLLLTDLVMPEVTGSELVQRLRLERQLPKVLMMSGYTDDDIQRRTTPADVHPFIKKPFTHQELALKVRQTLDSDAQRAD